jgi:hypothetical protein
MISLLILLKPWPHLPLAVIYPKSVVLFALVMAGSLGVQRLVGTRPLKPDPA